ncbi:MAG: efflux RND transporter periplasmic adaptor subunit [Candidatus Aminicenantes bacterium]|nr:efflux RND transporter periplasmic adaptor subunit [Candidatus Aminicenantes bacterium]
MSRRPKTIIIALIIIVIIAIVVWRGLILKNANEGEKVEPEVTVEVAPIVRTTLHRVVVAYGVVEAQPAGENTAPAGSRIASPFAGMLAQVYCREGQSVRKGDALFSLDSRVADLAVEKARQSLVFAEFTDERQKKLLAVEGTAQKNVEEAELQLKTARNDLANAQIQQKLLQIIAPIDGMVTQIFVRPGESVETATILADVVDLERLIVTASVPVNEAAALRTDQTVELTGGQNTIDREDAPAIVNGGKLIYVGAAVDPKSDTVTIRATLPRSVKLQLGRFLTLRIICAEHAGCLAVPEAALVKDDDGNPAIMLVESDHALQKVVKAGLRDAGLVEVAAEGLKEGQQVITDGAYGLPDKTKVVTAGDKKHGT